MNPCRRLVEHGHRLKNSSRPPPRGCRHIVVARTARQDLYGGVAILGLLVVDCRLLLVVHVHSGRGGVGFAVRHSDELTTMTTTRQRRRKSPTNSGTHRSQVVMAFAPIKYSVFSPRRSGSPNAFSLSWLFLSAGRPHSMCRIR